VAGSGPDVKSPDAEMELREMLETAAETAVRRVLAEREPQEPGRGIGALPRPSLIPRATARAPGSRCSPPPSTEV